MYRSLLAVLLYVCICNGVPKPTPEGPNKTVGDAYADDEKSSGPRSERQLDTTVSDLETETAEAATETPEVRATTLAATAEVTRATVASAYELEGPNGRSVAQQSPRFYSKLSYFQKNQEDRLLVNLLESKSHRRKFRSKCRCEKISNCPKLQMSVGRCPEEYFMCCF